MTEICKFQQIIEAKVTVVCDNISALNQALDTTMLTTSKHPDHDLLFAMRNKMQQSNVQWNYIHVRGHQEDKKQSHELSRLELLNFEMG